MRYAFFFSISYILAVLPSVAQPGLYLEPQVGIDVGKCYIQDNAESSLSFTDMNAGISLYRGMLLHYDIDDMWSISGGVVNSEITFGFRIRNDQHTNAPPPYYFVRHATGSDLRRFPLIVKRILPFTQLNLFKVLDNVSPGKSGFRYHAFLQPFVGISFDYDVRNTGEGLPRTVQWRHVTYTTTYLVERRTGASLWLGLNWQFRDELTGSNRWQLSVHYIQGIRNRVDIPVEYTVLEQPYYTLLGSRGSAFGAKVAYLIPLYRRDKI